MKFKYSGFSLVEIVLSLAILGIILGASIPTVHRLTGVAEVRENNKKLTLIQNAIIAYYKDNHEFPIVLNDLHEDRSISTKWNGPYILGEKRTVTNQFIFDPWGNDYFYGVFNNCNQRCSPIQGTSVATTCQSLGCTQVDATNRLTYKGSGKSVIKIMSYGINGKNDSESTCGSGSGTATFTLPCGDDILHEFSENELYRELKVEAGRRISQAMESFNRVYNQTIINEPVCFFKRPFYQELLYCSRLSASNVPSSYSIRSIEVPPTISFTGYIQSKFLSSYTGSIANISGPIRSYRMSPTDILYLLSIANTESDCNILRATAQAEANVIMQSSILNYRNTQLSRDQKELGHYHLIDPWGYWLQWHDESQQFYSVGPDGQDDTCTTGGNSISNRDIDGAI